MFDKKYIDTDTSDYVFAIGILYTLATLSINAGFFSVIGFDYSLLFSSTDFLIANLFVVKTLVSGLWFIPVVIWLYSKLKHSKMGIFIARKIEFEASNPASMIYDKYFIFLCILLLFATTNLISAIIPDEYFVIHVSLNGLWFMWAIWATWSLFVDGNQSIGRSMVFLCFNSIIFFGMFGNMWAKSILTDYEENIYVTAYFGANIDCLPRRIIRSSGNGILFWSPTGKYIDFMTWDRIRSISNLQCVQPSARPA